MPSSNLKKVLLLITVLLVLSACAKKEPPVIRFKGPTSGPDVNNYPGSPTFNNPNVRPPQ
jgi:hypothetical protein